MDSCAQKQGGLKLKTPALYCRVSTDKQSSGLEAQERALREHLKSQNISNATFYKDENISGGKSSRPELDKMMNAARNGKHDSIIVYSFSRFARSTKHLLAALDEFDQLGIQFISLTEKLDTSSAIGKALFTIISAISQLERELVSERVKNGLANAKSKGKQIGRPRQYNEKLIQELATQGLSYRKIANLVGCSPATVCREIKALQK